ncbi:hypothetical protein ACFRKB_38710 [Streptomyces scopuliridis]|uniref:hypothetical protein n=1 Tax=Streptomyces scopuliridis TaxID=452529 RepID=UPI0036769CEB
MTAPQSSSRLFAQECVRQAVPGSVVLHWEEGLAPVVPPPDYQRIIDVLVGGNGMSGEAMD